MSTTTKFRDVADIAANLAGDESIAQQVTEEISRNKVVSLLMEMRIAKGLTQEQIAEAMHVDASTVSRIESDTDRQLKWIHICGYAKALKLKMNILFDDSSLPASDRIKR